MKYKPTTEEKKSYEGQNMIESLLMVKFKKKIQNQQSRVLLSSRNELDHDSNTYLERSFFPKWKESCIIAGLCLIIVANEMSWKLWKLSSINNINLPLIF